MHDHETQQDCFSIVTRLLTCTFADSSEFDSSFLQPDGRELVVAFRAEEPNFVKVGAAALKYARKISILFCRD